MAVQERFDGKRLLIRLRPFMYGVMRQLAVVHSDLPRSSDGHMGYGQKRSSMISGHPTWHRGSGCPKEVGSHVRTEASSGA